MRIPIGNFGFKGPDPVQHTRISGEGIDAVAVAAQNLARAGMGLINVLASDDKEDPETKALNRARAGNEVLDYEINVKELVHRIQEEIASGKLRHDNILSYYNEEVKKIQRPVADGVDPVTAENVEKATKRAEFGGLNDVMRLYRAAKRSDAKQQVDKALNDIEKLAVAEGANVEVLLQRLDALNDVGFLGYGDNWEKLKQNFKDNTWAGHATFRLLRAHEDLDALKQLERDLTDAKGLYANKLDLDKHAALLSNVKNQINATERAKQFELDRREQIAERAIRQIENQVSTGYPATAEMWNNWAELVKGTSHEVEFRELVQHEVEIQNLLRRSIGEQQAYVDEKHQVLRTKGGSVRDVALFSRLAKAVDANIALFKQNPLVYAQLRNGAKNVVPIDMSLIADPNQRDKIEKQFNERIATLNALRKTHGYVPMKPLFPQEAGLLITAMNAVDHKKQAEILGAIYRTVNDADAYMAAMDQISNVEPLYAMAGKMYALNKSVKTKNNLFRPDEVTTSIDSAATMLHGVEILTQHSKGKQSAIVMPPEKEFSIEIQDKYGEIFRGRRDALETAIRAVRAYYVGQAVKQGAISAELDHDRMKTAVKAVLGNVVDVNGNGRVFAPLGMEREEFEEKAKNSFIREFEKHSLGEYVKYWPHYGLINYGDGTYYVTYGRSIVTGKNGAPVIVDVYKVYGTEQIKQQQQTPATKPQPKQETPKPQSTQGQPQNVPPKTPQMIPQKELRPEQNQGRIIYKPRKQQDQERLQSKSQKDKQ